MNPSDLQLIRITSLFPSILLSMVLALGLAPGAIGLSRRLGLLDVPGSSWHKLHESSMPMGGGMVIAACLLVSTLWSHWLATPQAIGILAGGLLVFGFGLWDDAKGAAAPQKLLGQFLGAAILVATGTQVRLFTNPALNLGLTVFWIVGVVNAFNFVDSMDGLALGLAGIAASFFMLVSIESEQPALSKLVAPIVGACIGLYAFNVHPARLFLGDSGSQLLGFMLAAVGVAYNPLGLERLSSWFVPILVLAVPIFDTSLVVFSRLRGRRPVYRAGRDHTYHRLVALGLQPTRAVVAMQTVGIAVGLLAFVALNSGPVASNALFGLAALLGGGFLIYFETKASAQ